MKKVIIFVEETEKDKIRKIKSTVARVLATYTDSVLAEVDEKQIESLKNQGINFKLQEESRKIKLAAVEFDPSHVPSPPPSLKLAVAEMPPEAKNYWIVQFAGPLNSEWRREISALGAVLRGYIPENALLAYMDSNIKEKVEKLPYVTWVGVYEPAYKISPVLMGKKEKVSPAELGAMAVAADKFKPRPTGNVNIVLHESADSKMVAQEIEKLGGKVVSLGKDRMRVSIDLSNIDKVAKIVDIKWIEPYVLPRLFNDVACQILKVQPICDNHGLDGADQIVGVADSGLDTGVDDATMHEDFRGKIVAIHSWPIVAGFQQYCDNTTFDDGASDVDSGHGTHVAGSVLGSGKKSGGSIKGVASKAKLVLQAVEQWTDFKTWVTNAYNLVDGYYLLGIPDNLNDLFQQAYDDGARIHTNSWGGTEDEAGNVVYGHYLSNTRDIDEFVWKHKDMAILFATGNEGKDWEPPANPPTKPKKGDGIIEPACMSVQPSAKNCIAVGASENNRPHGSSPPPGYDCNWGSWADFPQPPISTDHVSNNPEGMAAFSSRGPTFDGRIKPDVVAPGTNILSVRSSVCSGTGWGLLPTSDPNRPYYMYMGGTSQATPLVAGTVALIRQYVQNVRLHKTPSAALLKALLIHGATQMTGQYVAPYTEVGAVPENNQGWGRANLTGSLFPNFPENTKFVDDPSNALATGDYKDLTVNVVDGSVPLKATLTWTDAPSELSAGGGLVNVLSLSLVTPSGTIVQGAPTDNNVQQVTVQNPANGTYTVRVHGDNVTTSEKQDYALVVSGGLEFVDLYIRDKPGDDGVPPLAKRENNSPDINFKIVGRGPIDFINAKIGISVTVHNRGTAEAKGATVSLCWATMSEWFKGVSKWHTEGITGGIDRVQRNIQKIDVPAHAGGTDGKTTATKFLFAISNQQVQDILRGDKVLVIIAAVNHPADPLRQKLVRWENNIAAKKLKSVPPLLP